MTKNSIQYFHQTSTEGYLNRVTVALELPSVKDILNTASLHSSPNIAMKMGISYVHPNDNYSRKVGRELALSRLKPIDFFLTQITFDDIGRHLYKFDSVDDNHSICLRLSHKSNKPHFIEYVITTI